MSFLFYAFALVLGEVRGVILNNGNLNTLVDNWGFYLINTPTNIENCPTGNSRGFLIVFKNASYAGHVVFHQDGIIYWRWGPKVNREGAPPFVQQYRTPCLPKGFDIVAVVLPDGIS